MSNFHDIRHLLQSTAKPRLPRRGIWPVAWAIFPCVDCPAFEQFCMGFELEFGIINSHPNNFKDPESFIDPLYAIDISTFDLLLKPRRKVQPL